jgi:hypothetical protein
MLHLQTLNAESRARVAAEAMRKLGLDSGDVAGLLVLAGILLLTWWFLSALLSSTLGQLLIYAAIGLIGYAIGRSRR